jgi:hypothetical protein
MKIGRLGKMISWEKKKEWRTRHKQIKPNVIRFCLSFGGAYLMKYVGRAVMPLGVGKLYKVWEKFTQRSVIFHPKKSLLASPQHQSPNAA